MEGETTIASGRRYGVENNKMHSAASMIPSNTNIPDQQCLFSQYSCAQTNQTTHISEAPQTAASALILTSHLGHQTTPSTHCHVFVQENLILILAQVPVAARSGLRRAIPFLWDDLQLHLAILDNRHPTRRFKRCARCFWSPWAEAAHL
jgi:hypothetical protein